MVHIIKKWYSFIHLKPGEFQDDPTHVNQIKGYFPRPAPMICPPAPLRWFVLEKLWGAFLTVDQW